MFCYFNPGCNNTGFYGSNCDTPCPTNCKDSTCHIQNGTCFMCDPGWTGTYCDTSKMMNSIPCHFKLYFFLISCIILFLFFHLIKPLLRANMNFCITECKGGWYGVNCSQPCTGHCRARDICNHVTGHCKDGCDAGWAGVLCEKGNFTLPILTTI